MASKKTNITLPQLPPLEIRIDGNWERVIDMTSRLGVSIQKGYNKGAAVFSNLVLNKVRNAIISGRPPSGSHIHWPPLADSYKARHTGVSFYHLTGLYARSIGIHSYKNRTIIGLPYNRKPSAPKARITLIQVAIILEYGSKHSLEGSRSIPARPLWKPSLQGAGGVKRLKKEVIHGIRSQLYKDFGINPKQIR